jgi:hypothetical protein
MAAPQVGDIVEAFCRHCRLNLDVTVAAVVGDETVSVVCRTCDEKQRYKPAQVETQGRKAGIRVVDVAPAGRSRRKARPRIGMGTDQPEPAAVVRRQRKLSPEELAQQQVQAKWDAATGESDSRHARPHREDEVYDVGELVLHKAFGMGVIEAAEPDGALRVLFRDGYQSLESAARPSPEDDALAS